jgi:predicted Zn-dependent peptidase
VVAPADVYRTWLLCCVVSLFASACHSELAAVRTAARLPSQVLDRAASGTRIATLPRPTAAVVRLSLFIDAGSRDASPPQAATLAAWIAAANGGAGIEATVYPDVTELALGCASSALDRCLDELARALATRDPSQSALSRARLKLRDTQRRGLVRDPGQAVDAMALHALLGSEARGFFSIGLPSDEPAFTPDSVAKFLRDHYGPTRALVVAAGDAEPARVRESVARSFGRLRPAAKPRTARELKPEVEPHLTVAFDAQAALAIAVAGRDEPQLNGLVSSLSQALSRYEPRIDLSGYVFDTRGGAIASLRVRSSDIELALDRVMRELARLKIEPTPAAPRRVIADDLINSSRRFGLSFGATASTVLRDFQFSTALLLDAGPGSGPKGQDTELETQNRRSEHAQLVFTRALGQAQPRTRGSQDEYGAALVAENGARIDVQFAQGPDVALALRVAFGAEQDPPLLHGQAALLATLTSLACAGMGPELLQGRLQQLGATLEPRVDPESYGLLLRVPKQHWQEGLDLGLRCIRSPSRDAPHFAEAALRLQLRLRAHAGALGYRARAAALIASGAPGRVAAWGDPGRIGNITARQIDLAARETQNGVRWAVGLVGPVPVRDAVDRIARRLADLPTGTLAKPLPASPVASAEAGTGPRATNATGVSAVVTWTATGKFQHPFGARLFARAIAALLSAVPGVEVLWQTGDIQAELGFAALALRLRPDVAPLLAQLLASAATSVDDRFIDKALEPAAAQAHAAQVAADAQLAVRAERAARTRLGATLAEPTAEDAQKLIQGLRAAQPRWAAGAP